MKLYTEKEVRKAIQLAQLCDHECGGVYFDYTETEVMEELIPIELPSDEEINKLVGLEWIEGAKWMRNMYQDKMEAEIIKQCAEQSTSEASKYAEGYKEGYKRALDYMSDAIKNKIEIKEDANNEFRKGTANTTGTTFLCTEFVSDQLFYKGTLPHCMRCGKPQYQHPIISNTI